MLDIPDSLSPTRCGLVAVVGAPNAGKSTLVNALVGQKVAIVSPKAQTTRTRLMGIAIHGEAQILLLEDRKSTRLNSSHGYISYAVFCLKKKNPRTNAGRRRRLIPLYLIARGVAAACSHCL